MRLQDKVAIITGSARGIGRATALAFADQGAQVVVCDLDVTGGEQTAADIRAGGGRAIFVQVNVTERASVDALVSAAVARFGRIDVLVNNAGVIRDRSLLKMTEQDFDFVINVNLKGVFNCTQAVAPLMVAQGSGAIINASSVVGVYGNYGQTNYVASKAGVIGMTKVWARELGPKGVRVNAVAPGFISTEMLAGIPDKVLEDLKAKIALRQLGRPEDIANAYVFLASDEAAYITGHVLHVDGGAAI
ncbi:3-oxoacyl-ACP reductase FabG [Candidatus Amarolinea dominans]|uniref:3-oxoacyl-[acyl-carrier-protein] reductase n=1 Tax=Candidatus Amarolinea dominans TaxID=3140696 RepID=UPI003135BA5E|nr:3-oxoacyl-ACP reductase FabG [Anaerolineae bacterium]MBK9092203.1 3-oxoacyl-ACP reductase FabG [Anaerolineae bacterium]MBK9229508.1 3-oxoacyl-ACP reductase FabG [Anaerolineae bacterium]